MKHSVGIAIFLLTGCVYAQQVSIVQIASGINAPTDIENAGDGSGRLFFVQQDGQIRLFRNGALTAQPFLDIRSKTHASGEQGLLGLAFPPGFAQRQKFFVDYTDLSGDTVIAQYSVSANPDQADVSSEIVLLHINQPFPNHNGGRLQFGPDGYLYIGMGDGGSGGDPLGNGQNLGTLLAKLLRIDVLSAPGTVKIPPNNPFVNQPGARPEIWAYGLRNPWRFSFDPATNDLWIADVGQDRYEEVDFQPASSHGGENYGWNVMEALHCYSPASGCNMQGITLPIAEYSHANGTCSITGGFVYRGRTSPGMRGIYLYADYCTGQIWGIDREGTQFVNSPLLSAGFNITTFGVDEAGEIYVANASNGAIYHVVGSIAPRLSPLGVVNAASFAPGLTPGSLATVFAAGILDNPGIVSANTVPLTTSLGGVSIRVNSTPAPMLAVANQNGVEQANFQVPLEVTGTMATVVVTRSGNSSTPVTVPVVIPQPAIYTADGTKALVVHNADYTLVSNARPLVPGEFAFLYASGLGPVRNQPATGNAAPVLAPTVASVQVSIAGVPCDVQYAGLAPGFVGVYQVNFQVPTTATSGAQDIVVSTGGVSSPAAKAPIR